MPRQHSQSEYDEILLRTCNFVLSGLVQSNPHGHVQSNTEMCDNAIDISETLLKRLGYGKREDKRH